MPHHNILPRDWTAEQVASWLESIGFQCYAELIARQHKVDGSILISLSESDLREKPLQLTVLGDIKRLYAAIEKLKVQCLDCLPDSPDCSKCLYNNGYTNHTSPDCHFSNGRCTPPHRISPLHQPDEERKTVFESIEGVDTTVRCAVKTLLAAGYCSISLLVTSFVMVIVHDRVPDMKMYPPLPDIVLDSIPLIPWAFQVCEVLACTLGIIWLVVLTFHKHRFILMRRMFSLTGTVFMLRCVTMLITSLSVPGVHLECFSQAYTDFPTKLKQALRIWYGMGMSVRGVRTCGDYMFSGHTTAVTLLNHFITEYTPEDWYYVHTTSWVMNLFSVFFILAGHEHYSIDVFVAFYISSRLFLYYHTMAYHAKSMAMSDSRTRIWFPLFWFFESGGQVGRVKNEYEWPLPDSETVHRCFTFCIGCSCRLKQHCFELCQALVRSKKGVVFGSHEKSQNRRPHSPKTINNGNGSPSTSSSSSDRKSTKSPNTTKKKSN